MESRNSLNVISPLNHLQEESVFPDILIFKIEASCFVMLNCFVDCRVEFENLVLFFFFFFSFFFLWF